MHPNTIVLADSILFGEFCSVLEQLKRKRKANHDPDRILYEFINDLRLKFASIKGEKNSSFFPVLRLLLPHRDRERSPFNLKEKRLGTVLVKVLSLPKQFQDAQKLLNFRSVQNSSHDSDFAGVVYDVLRKRIHRKSSSLTIGDINDILDKIAPADSDSKSTLDDVLSYVCKSLTADQLKWFFRIILKDLKLGMGEHRLLAAFHLDAPEYFDNCADLMKVCEEIADGDSRPLELGLQLFYHVSPMLSERLNITQIRKILPNKNYITEDKFDGERFQMHMENGIFEYFSRKGHKYADNYGKTYHAGLLTPHLKGKFSEDVKSVILDGEMMGWNKEFRYFGSKGMSFDVKKITENSKYRPCYCVFDILFYNGKSLVGTPEKGGLTLKDRLKILDTVFTDVPGVIQRSKRTIVQDSVDILNALNTAIENQDEGIVLKDVDSYYIANKRNVGWYKIKPEYTDSTMTDLDLVVIGADEAENKRQGRAKSFHVACRDAADGGAVRWVCVGRVSSGVSHDERERMCTTLEKHWVRTARSPPPPCLYFNKEKPDLWLLPQHSIVLTVRATELIRSTSYGAAYTLRFPRVTSLRPDKPVHDVMALQEFDHLASSKAAVVKLSSKCVNADQIVDSGLRVTKRQRKNIQVGEQFRAVAAGHVLVTSQALRGRKLCVLSEDPDCSKAELVHLVESHAGKHVQNIGEDTWCAVAGKLTEKVKALMTEPVDIISAAWLRGLPQSDAPCALAPLDMLSMKPTTRLTLSLHYDRFGDGYSELTDEATLRKCFDRMEKNELPIYLLRTEMLKIDEILFGDNNPCSFLRSCVVSVEKPLHGLVARMYGAAVREGPAAGVTHVLVSPKNTGRGENLNKSVSVVSEEWLEACISQKKLVREQPYLLQN